MLGELAMAIASDDEDSSDEELVDALLLGACEPLVKDMRQQIGPERLSLARLQREALLHCAALYQSVSSYARPRAAQKSARESMNQRREDRAETQAYVGSAAVLREVYGELDELHAADDGPEGREAHRPATGQSSRAEAHEARD